jgi:hypothetical protein
MNLACVVIVVATAVGAFLLGCLYFGEMGGWLAAAACLYAPYFAVDLYVRTAWAEFAAFPFFALSLYGFGAYAKDRHRSHLLLGTATFAGILASHNGAALLFAPLLAAFIAVFAWTAKSWKVLAHQAVGLALGLGLAAFAWIPSLLMQKFVQIASLIEESNYATPGIFNRRGSARWTSNSGRRARSQNRELKLPASASTVPLGCARSPRSIPPPPTPYPATPWRERPVVLRFPGPAGRRRNP